MSVFVHYHVTIEAFSAQFIQDKTKFLFSLKSQQCNVTVDKDYVYRLYSKIIKHIIYTNYIYYQ